MGDEPQVSQRSTAGAIGPAPLPVDALRWRCDPSDLAFDSTAELEPIVGVIGQEHAVEALEFGLETGAPGQNIFVRGLTGTGRMTLLKQLLEHIRPSSPPVNDRCYVHNFAQPDQPRLITLPAGHGEAFRRRIDQLADFIRDDLGTAFTSEGIKARRRVIDQIAQEQLDEVMKPFNEALKEAGLALATLQAGPMVQTAISLCTRANRFPPRSSSSSTLGARLMTSTMPRSESGRRSLKRSSRRSVRRSTRSASSTMKRLRRCWRSPPVRSSTL